MSTVYSVAQKLDAAIEALESIPEWDRTATDTTVLKGLQSTRADFIAERITTREAITQLLRLLPLIEASS